MKHVFCYCNHLQGPGINNELIPNMRCGYIFVWFDVYLLIMSIFNM